MEHELHERELRLARERSERLSALAEDAENLLEAYDKRCVEALADLSPEERREVYKLLDYLTSPSRLTLTEGSSRLGLERFR